MHTSLSGFVLSESVRKSTKPSCFCRMGSTSFFNLPPTCSLRPTFDWHSTTRAKIEVPPSFLWFFEIWRNSEYGFVKTPLPTSGDLHPKETPADHPPLEALPRGRASVCDGAS